ncbi:hypothetical protein [Saccharopolyspora dendranthemae]|uniref:Uncharacterized protein n=1 Tax=Saccharopolyspora dendranthemae TaxID=1181886 RepID=A0A561U3P8_9PSEU|nr:hypothetical protein [Saccharopolyspora dendranthemae]TWF93986.1 hypothetical protein FHU35_14268 [Saccharopolyspora dendranthemae]
MSEDAEEATAETHFKDEVTATAIHTGTGHVFNIFGSGHESVLRQIRPRLTFRGDLSWSEQRFAAPPGLDDARAALRKHGTALLTGPRGSGRSTAAKVVVNESAGDQSPYALLTEEPYDPHRRLGEVSLLADHRLVLDLLDASEEVFLTRMRELPEFRARLVSSTGYLVVVVPDEFAHHLGDELRPLVARIDRPAGPVVLRRHLEAEGFYPAADQLDSEDVSASLALPMAEISGLATRIIDLSRSAPDRALDALLAEAISEQTDRREEASKLVEQRTTGRDRAILLASAMCHGASGDAVFFASHRLVELLGLGDREGPRIEQPGYRAQLSDLGIDLLPPNRIDLGARELGRALLEHFWDNYPDLRETYCQWCDEVIRMPSLTGTDRLDLVDRFTGQALRTNSPGHVRWLIERWLEPRNHRSRPLRDFGVRALTNGLEDPRHGREFRRLVREWAKEPGLPDEVGQVLVTLTTTLIAPNYPDQAVVRLHHRARRENEFGDPTAREALLSLTADSDFLLRSLLRRLREDLPRTDPWAADFVLFAQAADPRRLVDTSWASRPLVAQQEVRSDLVACWQALFAHRPDHAARLLTHWLATAGRISNADLLLSILVEAAQGSVDLLADLHVAARDWSQTAHGHPHVAVRLSQLVDLAQGLQNQDYAYPRPEEFVR